MQWLWLATRKLLGSIVLLVVVAFVVYVIFVAMAGDVFLPNRLKTGTPEERAAARAELGLDDPLPLRFGRWFAAVLSGRFGASPFASDPSADRPLTRPPWSALFSIEVILWSLAVFGSSLAVAFAVGTVWGVLAAVGRGGSWEPWNRWTNRLATSIPGFLWALGLLLAVSFLAHGGHLGLRFEPRRTVFGVIPQWPAPALQGAASLAWRTALSWLVVALPFALHVSHRVRAAATVARRRGWPEVAEAGGLSVWGGAKRHLVRPAIAAAFRALPTGGQLLIFGSLIGARVLGLPTFSRLFLYALYLPSAGFVLSGILLYAVVLVVLRLAGELSACAVDPLARMGLRCHRQPLRRSTPLT